MNSRLFIWIDETLLFRWTRIKPYYPTNVNRKNNIRYIVENKEIEQKREWKNFNIKGTGTITPYPPTPQWRHLKFYDSKFYNPVL